MIIGTTANINLPLQSRTNCQYRNKCWLGCPFGGYFSTQSSTLPAAYKTGNLTLRPFSIVTEIIYDKDTKKAKGVRVLDAETNQTYDYLSKVVFVNASTLNSTWILKNSATDIWPEGLGSSSGELGHNLMDHHFRCGASGKVEGYEDKYYYGKRPNGVYIPRFRNLNGEKRDYIRGFGYQGSASRDGWGRDPFLLYPFRECPYPDSNHYQKFLHFACLRSLAFLLHPPSYQSAFSFHYLLFRNQ